MHKLEDRAETNFSHWLKTVHLEGSFPQLLEIEDRQFDYKFFAREDGKELERIIHAILGSPRTMILFSPGHGTSTMFRAVLNRMSEDRALRLHVPIQVGDGNLSDGSHFVDVFATDIFSEICRQLVGGDWENRLYGQRYQAFQRLFNTKGYKSLEDLLFELRYQKDDDDFGNLAADHFNYTADELGDLYRLLHEEAGIETILAFDLPHNTDDDLIFDLVGEIKYFDDSFRTNNYPPAALSEVYFCTVKQMQMMKTSYQRDFNIYRVPEYSRAEVFAILATHYQARTGRNETALQTVLPAEFLDEVWDGSKTLSQMMDDLRSLLISQLNISREEVTFEFYKKKQKET